MTKPEIEFQEGPAPTQLVIKDLVVGEGAEAEPGSKVEVHYVGSSSIPVKSSTRRGAVVSPSPSRCPV
ncbi:peptidyl-prolyl cis-trans isomerase [Rhodococcus pyridinivorans AK37]|uniref:Peptidyl-prolyl cis-trans isomerase n=1 Tax=Rhodococcus pyridinivorans AK37 TaxID=1114960 RepID=H0JPL6_9NOCA|nr:peptidyl-prolyl cis-trans isomerase [Rhodococcus pyridinivorans AK37]